MHRGCPTRGLRMGYACGGTRSDTRSQKTPNPDCGRVVGNPGNKGETRDRTNVTPQEQKPPFAAGHLYFQCLKFGVQIRRTVPQSTAQFSSVARKSLISSHWVTFRLSRVFRSRSWALARSVSNVGALPSDVHLRGDRWDLHIQPPFHLEA
jgi:hypothetical protein